jgi:hypothetical protein
MSNAGTKRTRLGAARAAGVGCRVTLVRFVPLFGGSGGKSPDQSSSDVERRDKTHSRAGVAVSASNVWPFGRYAGRIGRPNLGLRGVSYERSRRCCPVTHR